MEVLGETLCQFQRDESNNREFDSFYFILFNYFILGYLLAKSWGGADISRVGPDLIQMSLAITSSVM